MHGNAAACVRVRRIEKSSGAQPTFIILTSNRISVLRISYLAAVSRRSLLVAVVYLCFRLDLVVLSIS